MAYLLDSDWVISAVSGNQRVIQTLDRLSPELLTVSWITLSEVYEGGYDSVNPEAKLEAYRDFLLSFRRLPMNDAIADQFGMLRADLRRRGNLIPDFDLMQAALALHYDLTLLTFNRRHFQRITDLRIYPHN